MIEMWGASFRKIVSGNLAWIFLVTTCTAGFASERNLDNTIVPMRHQETQAAADSDTAWISRRDAYERELEARFQEHLKKRRAMVGRTKKTLPDSDHSLQSSEGSVRVTSPVVEFDTGWVDDDFASRQVA
jgi:hypothetical protein